jgi:hypothetical protein
MAAVFSASMDGQGVIDLLTEITAGIRPAMVEQLTVVSEIVKTAMKLKAPEGVGGDNGLRGSIDYVLDTVALTSEVKPSAPYGDAVETGSKPHWPPAAPDSALAAWAKLKGINVYALAASIAKNGTRPHPYIVPTYDESGSVVGSTFVAGIKTYLEGFSV